MPRFTSKDSSSSRKRGDHKLASLICVVLLSRDYQSEVLTIGISNQRELRFFAALIRLNSASEATLFKDVALLAGAAYNLGWHRASRNGISADIMRAQKRWIF